MPWPSPPDYSEALQDPAFSFDDPELKAGQPATNNLGLPLVVAGNFACVFRVRSGGRDWAVRCFFHDYPDQEQRYAAISAHLRAAALPYTVRFEYLRRGVRVRGSWYPILKMEWLQGQTLSEYLAARINDPSTLLRMADEWALMVSALARASIAHGDLQHGNILVVQDRLRVIDYDGMYVPGLAGRTSHEIGHRNYQHPRRTHVHFGPYIDNFSAWVIYLSLVGLAVEPALRRGFSATNEYLVFRKEDFEQPMGSTALAVLTAAADPRVRLLVDAFRGCLTVDPPLVPVLTPAALSAPLSTPLAPTPSFQTSASAAADVAPPIPAIPDLSWITDHLADRPPLPPRVFPTPWPLLRWILAMPVLVLLGLAGLVGLPGAVALVFLATIAVVIEAGVLFVRYRRAPVVREMRRERKAVKAAEREKVAAQRGVDDLLRRRQKAAASFRQRLDEIGMLRARAQQEEKDQIDHIAEDARRRVSVLDGRRQDLMRRQTEEVHKVKTDIGRVIAELNTQLAQIDQQQARDLAAQLTLHQEAFVRRYLESYPIERAPMPGAGRSLSRSRLTANLRAAGIRTAWDVSYHRVHAVSGFGDVRSMALSQWRGDLEWQARNKAPQLPSAQRAAIEAKYQQRRQQLEARRAAEEGRLQSEPAAIIARYAAQVHQVNAEQAEANTDAQRRAEAVSARFRRSYEQWDRETVDLNAKLSAAVADIDVEIAEARKKVFAADYELAEIRHAFSAFREISYRRYVRRVLLAP